MDQLIEHEGEGSVYFITFRVESVLKYRYINDIANSMWDQTVDGKPTNTIAFGASEITNGGDGVTWKIVDVDKIQFCKYNNPFLNITFLSETSAVGSYINQQGGGVQTSYSAKKRDWDHLSAKNIIGSSWDYYWDPGEPPILMEIGDGTIDFPQLNVKGITWKFRGRDYMYIKNLAKASNMFLFFDSENSFKGKSWDGVTMVFGKRRAGASSQQQNQQTFQHRFIHNLVGSPWTITDPGGAVFTFTFGNGIISNFSAPGTYWDKVTWAVSGNDKIQLRTDAGALMDLTFNDAGNFSGTFWNNGTNLVSGKSNQPQYQQQQTLQHYYLNNIVGTSWTFSDPTGGVVTFNFGQDKLINVNPAGTFWDAVTWKVAGTDIIELRTNNGAIMNLVFANKNYFSGYSWYNKNTLATGTMNQQYQQQQQKFQHQFSNNLTGTLWTFYNPDGSSVYISFSENIVNAPPGYGWEGVTWKYTGNDKIRFTAPNGAVMDLSFPTDYRFNGFLWNDTNKKITALKN